MAGCDLAHSSVPTEGTRCSPAAQCLVQWSNTAQALSLSLSLVSSTGPPHRTASRAGRLVLADWCWLVWSGGPQSDWEIIILEISDLLIVIMCGTTFSTNVSDHYSKQTPRGEIVGPFPSDLEKTYNAAIET